MKTKSTETFEERKARIELERKEVNERVLRSYRIAPIKKKDDK